MKKNLTIYACCLLMSALCCSACYDDKGNYTYHNIDEITISGLEESYTVLVGEPITIKPQIESTLPGDEADYSYEWVWVGGTYQKKYNNAYVWSKEKEWDEFAIGLPSGTYKFYYRVKDERTGVKWSSDYFTIQIINDISTGFFILSEVNDIGRLDFINFANSVFDLRLDILTKIGSEVPALEKPLGVACLLDNNSPYMGASLVSGENAYMTAILTEKGMYRLHPSTLLYEEKYNMTQSIFVENLLPSDFYVKKVLLPSSSSNDFILVDNHNNLLLNYPSGRLYVTANTFTNTYTGDKHRMNISQWSVYPNSLYYAVMYDTDNLSFARQTSINATEATYYSATLEKEWTFDEETLLFKFNNTGKELIYMHHRAGEPGYTAVVTIYGILKEPGTGELFLACFSHTGAQRFYRRLKNLPELATAKEIAMTWNSYRRNYANSFLYYRTDTKIYAYDMVNNTTEVVFETDAGELISHFKFMQIGNTTWADRLLLCTYNPSLPAESCGKLRVMQTESTYGRLSVMKYAEEEMVWEGFGKIIDLSWKDK